MMKRQPHRCSSFVVSLTCERTIPRGYAADVPFRPGRPILVPTVPPRWATHRRVVRLSDFNPGAIEAFATRSRNSANGRSVAATKYAGTVSGCLVADTPTRAATTTTHRIRRALKRRGGLICQAY